MKIIVWTKWQDRRLIRRRLQQVELETRIFETTIWFTRHRVVA